MIRYYTIQLIAFLMLFCNVKQSAFAQSAEPVNIASSAVPFLRITPDSRSAALGGAGVAISPGVNAVYHNIAQLPFAQSKTAVSANFSPWMKQAANDVYLAAIGGYHRLKEGQTISAAFRYFNLGNIQFTDVNGKQLQTYDPKEFSLDVSYSRPLSEKIALGIALTYINSSLATGQLNGETYKAGNAVAGNIALYYDGLNRQGQGWSAGLLLSNLGSKISYTANNDKKNYIPANLGAGIAYTLNAVENNTFMFTLEGNNLLVPAIPGDQDMKTYYQYSVMESWFKSFELNAYAISTGVEYSYDNILVIRGGYHYENTHTGGQTYFTAGLGLKYNGAGVDFSYLIPSGGGFANNPLSNTVSVGLSYDFEK